jgi:hypothetical protein
MAPMNGYVYNMHRVPTYAEIIEEAIIHPVDKIKLPDRQALFIRNLPQLTRFDKVDDPASIGEEQERIQVSKLKELSLRQLAPGGTQSIARLRDTQRRPQDQYTPNGGGPLQGPPKGPPPSKMRRIGRAVGQIGSAIGNGAFDAMTGTVDYITSPAEPPFQYFQNDHTALYNADEAIRAQQEKEDWERMDWMNSWVSAARIQAHAALSIPESTAQYYIAYDEEPPSSGGASSSSGAQISQGSSAVDAAHQKALAAAKKKAAEREKEYDRNTGASNHQWPPPGGGGGGHRGPGSGSSASNAISAMMSNFRM